MNKTKPLTCTVDIRLKVPKYSDIDINMAKVGHLYVHCASEGLKLNTVNLTGL